VGPGTGHNCALGPTSSGEVEAAAALAGASFEELCHHGTKWTCSNWCVKLYRYTLHPFQQVYLFWQALRPTPTNQVTVSLADTLRIDSTPRAFKV
jgi:hypothetical protein